MSAQDPGEFEAELGQALFGNATAECGVPDSVARRLYDLSERLADLDAEAQHHGLFGGEFGYGQTFDNDVFAMFPYWWGDCECGFEVAEFEWSEANQHTAECFHTEYTAFHDSLDSPWSDEGQKASLDWLQARGIDSTYGVMLRCDCGHRAAWEAWRSEHDHAEDCPTVRPNFLHKPSGTRVHWYKYIGRSMSADRILTEREWRTMFDECVASLAPAVSPSSEADQ